MNKRQIGRRQLLSLGAAALLGPSLRLYPTASAAQAGRAAWLCALAALPVLLLYLRFLCRLLDSRRDGEGLAELILRALGPRLGRAALALLGLWLLLYAGFTLRAGAERYTVTVFPYSGAAGFALTLGALALLGALGPVRSLARAARMALPWLLLLLLPLLLVGLASARRVNLLPLTVYDLPALARGALPVIDVLSMGLYTCAFLLGEVPRQPGGQRDTALALGGYSLLLSLAGAAVIGSLGAELCLRLSQPFFTLVRNLVFFRTLERVEAFVATLWVLPDFLLAALLLFSAQHCLRLALGQDPRYRGQRRWDLSGGRWLILLCGLTAAALGLLLAPDAAALLRWSLQLIPTLNLGVAFGLLPLIYIIGRQRKAL